MAGAVYLVGGPLFVSRITQAADHHRGPAPGAPSAAQLAAVARGARLLIAAPPHPPALRWRVAGGRGATGSPRGGGVGAGWVRRGGGGGGRRGPGGAGACGGGARPPPGGRGCPGG